jgi:hypothetical protein
VRLSRLPAAALKAALKAFALDKSEADRLLIRQYK